MSWLQKIVPADREKAMNPEPGQVLRMLEDESTEDMLLELARFGRPSLMQHSDGTWGCSVDVKVNSTGVDFKVRADHNHKNMRASVRQCLERLRKSLSDLGVQV